MYMMVKTTKNVDFVLGIRLFSLTKPTFLVGNFGSDVPSIL